MHLAATVNVPIVLLLGTNAPDRFLPVTDDVNVIRSDNIADIQVLDVYRSGDRYAF